jgi:hypothetical protein
MTVNATVSTSVAGAERYVDAAHTCRQPDSITIESRSWYLTSRLIFETDPAHVKLSTHVRYDRPIAKALWPPVSILHRQILPRLLRHAAARTA